MPKLSLSHKVNAKASESRAPAQSSPKKASSREGLPVHFDEQHVLHQLKHYLPAQASLKDFIHHNSLHAYQHLKFYDAIFKASAIFGYQVTLQLS